MRLAEFYDALIVPPKENYEESRVLRTGIKLNYSELKLSTFRMKRFLAAYYELGKIQTHFLSFKYPLFTTTVLLLSVFVLLV